MSDLLGQLPVLVGVVVGALCSYLVRAASDRTQWRREKNMRWDTRRMETYAAYSHAVKTAMLLAIRVAAQRGLGEVMEKISIGDGLAKLSEAQLARTVLWEQVLLLGDPATIGAARRWHEASWLMDEFARGKREGLEGWTRVRTEANDARDAFYEAARRDLGVAGLPPVTTWSRRPVPETVVNQPADSEAPSP